MLELLAQKIGMTHIFKNNGLLTPITMIKLHDNKIISLEDNENGYKKTKIAYIKTENTKNINKSIIGFYAKKQIPIHKKLRESKCSVDAPVAVGESVDYNKIFKEGDKISIRGTSTGKGFAGVMKRWNFKGLEASHGVSISHRSHGSTGQRQDPGKTFRGKKMAGHLGVENVTIKNLKIEYIDLENSVIGVKGAVPGRNGSELVIKLNNY